MKFVYEKILPYLPNCIIRFIINCILTYNLFCLKKYNVPIKEEEIIKQIEKNNGNDLFDISISSGNVIDFQRTILGDKIMTQPLIYNNDTDTLEHAQLNKIKDIENKLRMNELEEGSNVLDLDTAHGEYILYLAEKYPKINFYTNTHNENSYNYFTSEIKKRDHISNINHTSRNFYHVFEAENIKFSRVILIDENHSNYNTILCKVKPVLDESGFLFIEKTCHRENNIILNNELLLKSFYKGSGLNVVPSKNLIYRYNEHLKVRSISVRQGLHYAKTIENWLSNLESNKNIVERYFKDNEYLYQKWRLFFLVCSECLSINNGNEFVTIQYIITNF